MAQNEDSYLELTKYNKNKCVTEAHKNIFDCVQPYNVYNTFWLWDYAILLPTVITVIKLLFNFSRF